MNALAELSGEGHRTDVPMRSLSATALSSIRLVMLHGALELGGAERQSLHLARYLRSRGAHVEMWGLGSPGRLARLCESEGIPWRVVPVNWWSGRVRRTGQLLRFVWQLRRAQPNVLFPYTDVPNVLLAATSRLTGAKRCFWNQRGIDSWIEASRLTRWAIPQVDTFISNSHHGARYLESTFGIRSTRIRVIRNGVDLPRPERDRETWRARLGVPARVPLACMVGNLTHFKDHGNLLRAWRLVVDGTTESKPTLLLAGGLESEAEPLRRLAWDLALGDSVRFLGFVDDVPGLLQAVDLGVFSSRSEGCPNGVLEPMAAGLPLVASDNEGVREALGDDRQTVSVGQPEATAKAVLAMFGSPELRRELGRRNRARVEADFSISAMCEQTVALISSRLDASD